MFEVSSKKVDFCKENLLIKKNINLDTNLDCFVLIDTKNHKFGEVLLNNILEFIINNISSTNCYGDFQIALENINNFIKTWLIDEEKDKLKINVIIGVLNKNNFLFSNIGKASCYLVKNTKEVIEITEHETKKPANEFSYISNGTLNDNEIIVMSSSRLLNYLSENDVLDGLRIGGDIKDFNKNIKTILLSENLEKNIGVTSIKYNALSANYLKDNKWNIARDLGMKALDNEITKTALSNLLRLKDIVSKQSRKIKNIIFLAGISVCLIILYGIIGTVIGVSNSNERKIELKENLTKAKTYIRIASENVNNETIFNLNIQNAESLISEVKDQELYLNDIEKINDDINLLKKQFNKIDIFDTSEENYLFKQSLANSVGIIKNNKKTFIINKKSVIGPILPDTKAEEFAFNSLEKDEFFVDAVNVGTDIYLMTNFSKIVRFTKNSYFSYVDVSGQATWDKSKDIESYSQNIYLVSDENSQIYRHVKNGDKFNSGKGYLSDEDITQIGEIKSIAIDGGFYLLKGDLSMLKFYSSPKYRLESLVLNKLPKNYNHDGESKIELKTRAELNYVYLLMNDKIWIFKPNSRDYRNTQSLTYIGQLEGVEKVKDFYVNYDGEILVLNEKGIYKLTYEVSDDRIIIR